MRSPAAAIAWEFRHRHRWGLVALIAYLIVLASIKFLVLAGQPIHLDSPESFAFVVVVPLTATFTYFLAVFTFGLEGDLAARQSMYPARMFTRPVTTAALVGWPMLYGTAAMAILWAATRLLALWPSGFDIPSVWPALLAASLLAWTQALTWMPYPLPGLRIVVIFLWLAMIDAIVLLALNFRAHEPVMVAILAPQIPLAYLAARFAVARARRGDIPDWRRLFAWLGPLADALSLRRDRFPSAASAQTWFEWRQHGRSLPALVGILLPFELALLFATGNTPALVFALLAGVLITPPFMAIFVAATVRSASPQGRDGYGLSPFLATRPLTSAGLIAAKLKATIWSTVVAWVLVLIAIPLALELSGTWPVVIQRFRRGADTIGMTRMVVVLLLMLSALILSTWKQLVQSLFIGLTGRARLIKGSVFVTLALLFLIGPILQWIIDNKRVVSTIWDTLPLVLAILVALKMSAVGWVGSRINESRLLSDRTLVIGSACWCAVVLGVYGILAWLFSTPFFPRYVLMLLAILAIPLARVAAAPLALDWNRHR